MSYQNEPSNVGSPPQIWPGDSTLTTEPGQPTLIMAVHPQCPCTAASIQQLARLMVRLHERVTVYVLFATSDAYDHESGLWREADRIPGVAVVADDRAAEAKRLNVLTSGHTLLFSADGELLFSGGITSSRGHEGDNAGSAAVLALALGQSAEPVTHAVFGCALYSRDF